MSVWSAVLDLLSGGSRGLPLKMCAELGWNYKAAGIQELWKTDSLSSSIPPPSEHCHFGTGGTYSLSSTGRGSGPHHCSAQVMHLALCCLAMPWDQQQLLPPLASNSFLFLSS